MTVRLLGGVVLMVLALLWSLTANSQLADPCARNDVYPCAQSIRDQLRTRASFYADDPSDAFALVEQWNTVYRRAYQSLAGQPRATSDVDKILEEVRSQISPIDWAVDEALEALVERYLSSLAPLVEFLSSAR